MALRHSDLDFKEHDEEENQIFKLNMALQVTTWHLFLQVLLLSQDIAQANISNGTSSTLKQRPLKLGPLQLSEFCHHFLQDDLH